MIIDINYSNRDFEWFVMKLNLVQFVTFGIMSKRDCNLFRHTSPPIASRRIRTCDLLNVSSTPYLHSFYLINAIEKQKNTLPGHLSLLQGMNCTSGSFGHGLPPLNGPIHSRVCLCWPPPHVREQVPSFFQALNTPSTKM